MSDDNRAGHVDGETFAMTVMVEGLVVACLHVPQDSPVVTIVEAIREHAPGGAAAYCNGWELSVPADGAVTCRRIGWRRD